MHEPFSQANFTLAGQVGHLIKLLTSTPSSLNSVKKDYKVV